MISRNQRPLAMMLTILLVVYAVVYRFMPIEMQKYCFWPFGALALYAGARLSLGISSLIVFGMMAATDLVLYLTMQYWPSPMTYLSFGLWMLLGRSLLRRSHSWERVVAGSLIGPIMFFLITNTWAWYEFALPEYQSRTFASLLFAYEAGLEFLRTQWGQMLGPVLSIGVFVAHNRLALAWFPEEQVNLEAAR